MPQPDPSPRAAEALNGLSPRDRRRIRQLIARCALGELVTRLDDLDAPGIAVGAAPEFWATRYSGEIGQWVPVLGKQVAVLVWWK